MAVDISRESANVVLDPEISSEIISKAIEESAFMQLAERMTIAGNGTKYQTIEGDPVPEWVGETDPAPVGKFAFGKKIVEPYKMELIVPFSNEFKRDKKGLYDECVNRLPKLFGRKFDRTVTSKTAPGENFDVLGASTAVSLTPASGATLYDQFVAVDEIISTNDGLMNGIALSTRGRSKVLAAKDGDGRPLFTAGVDKSAIDNILGAQVSVAKGVYVAGQAASGSGESAKPAVPATLGLAGDFENCSWGAVENIRGSVSEDATLVYEDEDGKQVTLALWQRDMFAVKFVFELAFMVRVPGTFVLLTE